MKYLNPFEAFIDFLETQLIPDLKESGRSETANEFKTAIKFMKGAKKVGGIVKNDYIEHLKLVAKDMREEGYESTPDDIDTCIKFIYWSNMRTA